MTKSRNIRDCRTIRGYVFRASRNYTADVTSATVTVNTFVGLNGEKGLQNRFPCIFFRGLLLKTGLTVF